MREINERIIQESQIASNLLEQFNAIESFLGDFSFLVLGRDNIVCKNYAFSLFDFYFHSIGSNAC